MKQPSIPVLSTISPELFRLMVRAVKTTGGHLNSLPLIEEELTFQERDSLERFYAWIEESPTKELGGGIILYPSRGFGHGNYEQRYAEFLEDTQRNCWHTYRHYEGDIVYCIKCGRKKQVLEKFLEKIKSRSGK